MNTSLLATARMCSAPQAKIVASRTWHRFDIPKNDIDSLVGEYKDSGLSAWAFSQKHYKQYTNIKTNKPIGWETFKRALLRAKDG